MKALIIFTTLLFFTQQNIIAQDLSQKKTLSLSEVAFITQVFEDISVSDQSYRGLISNDTTDPIINAKIDSVFDSEGIGPGLAYKASLNLSLDPIVEDSLWNLQHKIDFQNHMILKGVILSYGWISKEVVKENNFVQFLLLVHPPKDWDIKNYLEEYSSILIEEVKAHRMPAKTYASFYDNIKGKILHEPQLYGTNVQFNSETKEIMPPEIKDLAVSNAAREAIGMPLLMEGEYRILKD